MVKKISLLVVVLLAVAIELICPLLVQNADAVQSSIVLTNNSLPLTLSSGDNVKLFGSSGSNVINIKAGAQVECVNFIGSNQINIEEASSQFKVYRSGATVYLKSNAGTFIKIPATKTKQIVKFAGISTDFVINGGNVMLGSQIVDKTEGAVNIETNQEYPTGNQDFSIDDAKAVDPLSDFRALSAGSDNLPSSVDHSSKLPEVRNQGNVGSCTAWATGYYYKTYQEVVEEGWDKNQNAFSPMYLFSMQCKNYSQPYSFIASYGIIKEFGCAKWATLPYQDYNAGEDEVSKYAATSIAESVHNEARQYRGGESSELSSIGELKQALTVGPVLLGINFYNSRKPGRNPSPENNYLSYDSSNSKGGHAILCVGYDDSKFGTGAIKFVNSWGSDWAVDGFSWIKYPDYTNIVMYAMSIKDLPNPNSNDNSEQKPSAPTNVSASDNAGPYVDVTWTKATTAQYYRIFRLKIGEPSSYSEISTTYSNNYRDYPEPGVNFYYSVVSVNDIGESEHFASDTDSKSYVDKGVAKGNKLQQPKLSWHHNDYSDLSSHFEVHNIDSAAKSMEVLVANTSNGPWDSFGWISPDGFYITWGEDSEYIGKQPFIKIIVSNSDANSEASDPIQVGEKITGNTTVANIAPFNVSYNTSNNSVNLTWNTDNSNFEYFNIFRYKASSDEGNEWIYIGSTDDKYYYDKNTLPGVSYYYAVNAMYQGIAGEFAITDDPVAIPISQPNLSLYQVEYNYGSITNPAHFNLTVWNTGSTAISDYSIKIYVYDWRDGDYYIPFEIFYASDYAQSGQLPLKAGSEHTISCSLNIPSVYADGHNYSWIVEIDYNNEITEKYEDDNSLQCSQSWWSSDLNPKPNLKLNSIVYNKGSVQNPVHFDLEVWNDGGSRVNDYEILIAVYDYDEDKIYSPFDAFYASDVADSWQLPLDSGYKHTLSFDLIIPSIYADGHSYYWIVMLDPYENIGESSEDDNSIVSSNSWWSSYLRDKQIDDSSEKSSFSKQLNMNYIEQLLINIRENPIDRTGESGKDRVMNLSGSVGTKIATTRPFSKEDILNLDNPKVRSRKDSKNYVGPIRYKKPSFSINRINN